METWFLNHVLGLSLSVLLLGLPRSLGTGTPINSSTAPVTIRFYSAAPEELSNTENNGTSTSGFSESLSSSQRNLLLTHTADTHTATAGNLETEQTQTLIETSSRSLETTALSTEPLASTFVVATTEASSSSSSSSSSTSRGGSSSSSSSSSSSTSSGGSSSSSTSSTSSGGSSSSSSSGGNSSIGSSSTSSSSSGSSSISSSSTSSSSSGSSSISSSSTSSSSGSSSSSSSTSSSSSISSSGSSSSTSSSSSGNSSSSSSGSNSSTWENFPNTVHVTNTSHAVLWETRSSVFTDDSHLSQDSTGTTLGLEDATASVSQTAGLTHGEYASTTISRAGERTLLSVTSSSSNSTSPAFTEKSNSPPPLSTSDIRARTAETEGYTHSAPSTKTDSKDTTEQHMTRSSKGMSSETGSPGLSGGTQSLTGLPNATHPQYTSTFGEISGSTPPVSDRVTEPSTDPTKVFNSSTPAVTSTAGGATNISGTRKNESDSYGEATTESSTVGHVFSTLTTLFPTVISSTSEVDPSLTDMPPLITKVFLSTPPVTITERPKITEEETFKATASITTTTTTITTTSSTTTSTTPPLPATSSVGLSSPTSTSVSELHTDSTTPNTTPSTTASTLELQTSSVHSNQSMPTLQTQEPSTGVASPTDVTTLQIETTSTGSLKVTTAHSHYITTTYTHRPPTTITEAMATTVKPTDWGTTDLVMTTSPTDIQPTKAPTPTSPPSSNTDDCGKNSCPPGFTHVKTIGSLLCDCPFSHNHEDGRTCTRAKKFLGTFISNKSNDLNPTMKLLNASLSVLQGYRGSILCKKEEDKVSILAVNIFSISSNVTSDVVNNSIQMSLKSCTSFSSSAYGCSLSYHVESLCLAQKTRCDTARSVCIDNSGTANCQCLQGYYKHNPDDLSCLECGDGYKLENDTCVPCSFGFGGFNCGNFYKLIAVIVSPAGGVVVLILIVVLIVTCCKKDKNDINKIIFKSGDLQMSPYADFPKNSRISMEWGRETIEMQENGSTKNLLQMTDIYYSPALRNSDLERNGLHPFMGLPGSRHSCIYPAQWNPSFINDDTRRRDYF